jgi:hypothetical protein
MAREKRGSSKFMACPYPVLAGNMTTDETDRWNPLFANVRYRAGKGSAELAVQCADGTTFQAQLPGNGQRTLTAVIKSQSAAEQAPNLPGHLEVLNGP